MRTLLGLATNAQYLPSGRAIAEMLLAEPIGLRQMPCIEATDKLAGVVGVGLTGVGLVEVASVDDDGDPPHPAIAKARVNSVSLLCMDISCLFVMLN